MTTIAEVETAEIKTLEGLREYVASLIETPDPVKYDLGCGKKGSRGFLGVDLYADTADVHADLFAKEWTFASDNSADMLYSSHFLEHVSDLNTFMTNAWKLLKNGGYFLITTPYGFSPRAWQDPDHKRPIFRETYWYFNKASRQNMGVDHYEGQADFDLVEMWPVWNKKYAARVEQNPALAEDFFSKFGAVDDLTVLLRARK